MGMVESEGQGAAHRPEDAIRRAVRDARYGSDRSDLVGPSKRHPRKERSMSRFVQRIAGPACTSLAFLLASCGQDPAAPGEGGPGPEPVVGIRVVADSLGPRTQSLLVTRQGQPVRDAVVTVNGTAIPHAGDGRYRGELPVEVAPGGTLDLAVSAGGASATGTGVVPDVPFVTSPTDGDLFADTTALRIRWTSATSPDRFVVVAIWSEGDSVASTSDSLPGSTRELGLPAREVPPETDVAVRVLAYNESWITGSAVDALSKLTVGGPEAQGPVFRRLSVPIEVRARFGPTVQNVWVYQAGVPHDGATVTVNGSRLTSEGLTFWGTPSGSYWRETAGPPAPGTKLQLRVRTNHATVDAVAFVPETPAITAPASAAVYTLADSISVAWTTANDPALFEVSAYNLPGVEGSCGDWFTCGLWASWSVEGAGRQLTAAAADIGSDDPIVLEVFAIDQSGVFSGPVEEGSELVVLSAATTTRIAIVP
jgi:hypothetical protein